MADSVSLRLHALAVATGACLALLTLLVTPSAAAIPVQPVTERSAVGEIHLDGFVQDMLQDRTGYLWFATQDGLHRYDGFTLRSYRRGAGAGWPDDSIWSLHEDASGALWIGAGKGLLRLGTDRSELTVYRHDPDDPRTIGASGVRVIAAAPDGRLWLGLQYGGLDLFDPRSGEALHYRHDPDDPRSIPGDHVRALHADSAGRLWIGTSDGGLAVTSAADEGFDRVDLPEGADQAIAALADDGDTGLWVGTFESGVLRLDHDGAPVSWLRAGEGSLVSDSVMSLFRSADGRLWVGSDGQGVSVLDPDGRRLRSIRHDPRSSDGLPDDHVVSFLESTDGQVWLGSYAGVGRWNPERDAFEVFRRALDAEPGLSSNQISAVSSSDGEHVWIGTSGGGLNRLDRVSGSIDHFHATPGGLADDRVTALLAEGPRSWVGTLVGGLQELDAAGRSLRGYRHDPSDPASLAADGVTSILRDRGGRLWVGTYGGGLARLRDDGRGFDRYRAGDGPGALASDLVVGIAEDRAGKLWIATQGSGLSRLDPATGRVETFRHDPEDPASLSSDAAWLVTVDGAGDLWVGTEDAGLNVLRDPAADSPPRFEHLSVRDGLPSRTVYTVAAQGAEVWVGTNRGLARYEAASGRFRVFDRRKGLPANDFNHGAAFGAPDGALWFGTTRGVVRVDPDALRVSDHVPRAFLTAWYRMTERIDVDGSSAAPLALEATHRDSLVAFEFASSDLSGAADGFFAHRLLGFEEEWVIDRGIRRATYTNLEPGEYRFELRAARTDGVWGPSAELAHLTVSAAPWATPWARAAYLAVVLVTLVLAAAAVRRRLVDAQRIAMANLELEAEVDRRRASEEALRTAQARAQAYLDVAEVVMLAVDADERIELLNEKGCRLLGVTEEAVRGTNFFDRFVAPAQHAALRARMASIGDGDYLEFAVTSAEGAERLIAWHVAATGGGPGWLASGLDVTEVRTLERQLQQTQKMEALGTLASGIAHDFNNTLTAITGFAELARADADDPAQLDDHIDGIEASARRARGMVERILAFGRRSPGARALIGLDQILEEVVGLIRPGLPAGVRLEAEISRDVGPVLADPAELHQVLMNLVTNAIHAMAGHVGAVRVALDGVTTTGEGGDQESWARLAVADEGCGIDRTTLERVFEPFFTTREQGEGTGLGLAVVHRIVTDLGGEIAVDSEPGRGARFEVRLPCAARALPASATEPAAPRQRPSGQERILLVDDEATVLSVVGRLLGRLGYRVEPMASGEAALERLSADPTAFDLLLTDFNMPGMNGEELARATRAIRGDLPVIMMSGAGRRDFPDADAFIGKPVDFDVLAHLLRSRLDRA
ncbi:MAG: two-component regulator propeller domain-containing protein [Pseudomonadales bacterium]|nr:two-component regulator propeller domain-containing protein [Pseudomonadales bacterium]